MEEEIRAAIGAGAPLYNAGRVADCARIYAETSAELERKYSVPDAIRDQFATARTEADASKKAKMRRIAVRQPKCRTDELRR